MDKGRLRDGLSPRERQVLEALLSGHSEKEVAGLLGISRHTVHVYVRALYRYFDVHTRAELMVLLLTTTRDASPSKKRGPNRGR